MIKPIRIQVIAATVFAGLLLGASSARAEVLIVSSDVTELKPNTEIGDNDRLKIPAGKSVRLLLPSGETEVVDGPADRPVRELTQGQVRIESVWARMKEYLLGRDNKRALGARGASARSLSLAERGQLAVSALLSFSAVPIPANVKEGAICVLNGSSLSFARLNLAPAPGSPDHDPEMRFAAGTSLDSKPALVRWNAQDEKAPWPNTVAPLDGGRYYAVPNFAEPSRFEIKMVSRDAVDGKTVLQVLDENHCYEQMKAWALAGGRR
jgi:hypothetical protein